MSVLQSDYYFARHLSSQPEEITLIVAAYLSLKELNSWMQTSRRFFRTLSSAFYTSAFGVKKYHDAAIERAARSCNIACIKKVPEYAPPNYQRGTKGYLAL